MRARGLRYCSRCSRWRPRLCQQQRRQEPSGKGAVHPSLTIPTIMADVEDSAPRAGLTLKGGVSLKCVRGCGLVRPGRRGAARVASVGRARRVTGVDCAENSARKRRKRSTPSARRRSRRRRSDGSGRNGKKSPRKAMRRRGRPSRSLRRPSAASAQVVSRQVELRWRARRGRGSSRSSTPGTRSLSITPPGAAAAGTLRRKGAGTRVSAFRRALGAGWGRLRAWPAAPAR